MFEMKQYEQSAAYVKERLREFVPEVLIILGSGLGSLGERVEAPVCIPYADIPYFKRSTALGHVGRYIAGRLGGKNVLLMQGRLHLYEGHTAEEAVYPVRVARLLGCESMIVTNAAGGVNKAFHPGQFMLISDFIKFAYPTPLQGPNLEAFGPRFPDMSFTFDREYMKKFREAAGEDLAEGVYFYMPGPQYETPAEIRAIRTLGGDAVGMSTVPECIAAHHAGMRILGVTVITNMAAGVLPQPLSGEEVVAAGNAAAQRLERCVTAFLERL